jgi:hypothetical protein
MAISRWLGTEFLKMTMPTRWSQESVQPFVLFLAFTLTVATVPTRSTAQSDALFDFHSNPWLNLHHILLAKGEGAALPTDTPEAERKEWADGLESYAPWSKRNLFDEELRQIKEALRTAYGKANLDGLTIDASVKATLERLMPIYRKHWWDAHDRSNREWIAAAQPMVDRHGAALNEAVARAYAVTKPDNPVWVDVSVRAGPVGAYTTSQPTHVMISSTDSGYSGYRALEMLFHERSHAWGRMLFEGVQEAANAQGIKVPQQLSHAVLFYTAGELTARELKKHGIAHMHYAQGVLYDRLCGTGCEDKLAAHWGPYLDGKQSRAEAFAALVASFK